MKKTLTTVSNMGFGRPGPLHNNSRDFLRILKAHFLSRILVGLSHFSYTRQTTIHLSGFRVPGPL